MEMNIQEMQSLIELLRPPEPEILQGDDLTNATKIDIQSRRDEPIEEPKKSLPKSLEEFEAKQERELEEELKYDTKKVPEYTMNFRQSVSAEDVYLQMGGKTPGSASCENLIVRIKMPGDKMENIELNVETKAVDVVSANHCLKLGLPHDVDPDKSKAAWDPSEECLVLTLALVREFDFVNF